MVRANLKTMLLLGAIGVGTHNALAYLGLNYTTATNGVILNSFIPVMIIAMAWIFFRERLAPLQLAGVAISLCGVLAILSQGSLEVAGCVPPERAAICSSSCRWRCGRSTRSCSGAGRPA